MFNNNGVVIQCTVNIENETEREILKIIENKDDNIHKSEALKR